jgi:hypothetical protein
MHFHFIACSEGTDIWVLEASAGTNPGFNGMARAIQRARGGIRMADRYCACRRHNHKRIAKARRAQRRAGGKTLQRAYPAAQQWAEQKRDSHRQADTGHSHCRREREVLWHELGVGDMPMLCGSPSWQGVLESRAMSAEKKNPLVGCVYASHPSAACERRTWCVCVRGRRDTRQPINAIGQFAGACGLLV